MSKAMAKAKGAATIKKTQAHCASLPEVVGARKWETDFVYTIFEKMFCVASISSDGKSHLGFKVDDDLFLAMTEREGFIPAPYLARAKWVAINDLSKVSQAEVNALVTQAYRLVVLKLPKYRQAALLAAVAEI